MANIFFFCDICNLSAAFLSCFMFFLRFMGIWQWTMSFPGFILLVLANLYGCYLIHRSKSYVVADVLTKYDSQPGLTSSPKRNRLEKRLHSRLLLSDLAEFSFGPLGCVLIDFCLVFLQLGWLTFSAPIAATSISVYFENASQLFPNATEGDSEILLVATPSSGAFAIAMGILLCFYLTTTLFQTVRQSSVLGALALISFLGVLTIIVQTIANVGIDASPSNETITNMGRQTVLYLDNHRLSSIQVVVALFTVEASMNRTRRAFLPTVFVCGFLTLFFGCFFVYVVGQDGYGILEEVDKRSSVHLLMITSAVCIFPLQNLPLYHVIERRLLKRSTCCQEKDAAEDQQALTAPSAFFITSGTSFMTKMREDDLEAFNTEDVAEDLQVKVAWPSRFAMRFAVVLFEMLLAYLLYSVRPLLRAFIFLCLLASRFLAVIFPVALFLKLRWFSSHVASKLCNVLVILLCITEVGGGTYYLLRDI